MKFKRKMMDSWQAANEGQDKTEEDEDIPKLLSERRLGTYGEGNPKYFGIASGRTLLCHEVLNEKWYCIKLRSESCLNAPKTPEENKMFDLEDRELEIEQLRYEMTSTRHYLEGLLRIIEELPEDEREKQVLDHNLNYKLGVHVRNLKKLYGSGFKRQIENLQDKPYRTLSAVIQKLDLKIKECMQVRNNNKSYYNDEEKRLSGLIRDTQSSFVEVQDEKELQSAKFIADIRDIFKAKKSIAIKTRGPHIKRQFFLEAFQDVMSLIKKDLLLIPDNEKQNAEKFCDFVCELFGQPHDLHSEKNYTVQTTLDNEAEKPPKKRRIESQLSNDDSSLKSSLDNFPIFINDEWYAFFRLFTILCERLSILKLHHYKMKLEAEEAAKEKKAAKAEKGAVKGKDAEEAMEVEAKKTDGNDDKVTCEEIVLSLASKYSNVLNSICILLKKKVDTSRPYEDFLEYLLTRTRKTRTLVIGTERARNLFGLDGYICVTLTQNFRKIAKWLSDISLEASSKNCVELYWTYVQHLESRNSTSHKETSYCNLRYENVVKADFRKNWYKMQWLKDESSITFELLESGPSQVMLLRNWTKQLKLWKSRGKPFEPSMKSDDPASCVKDGFEKSTMWPEDYFTFNSSSGVESDEKATNSAILRLGLISAVACAKQNEVAEVNVLNAEHFPSEMELDKETSDTTNREICSTVCTTDEEQSTENPDISPEVKVEVEEKMSIWYSQEKDAIAIRTLPLSKNYVDCSKSENLLDSISPEDMQKFIAYSQCSFNYPDCSKYRNMLKIILAEIMQKIIADDQLSANGLDCSKSSVLKIESLKVSLKTVAEKQLDCDCCSLFPLIDKMQQFAQVAEIKHYLNFACDSCDYLEDNDYRGHTIAENPSYGNVLVFKRHKSSQEHQQARQKCDELRQNKFSKWHQAWLEKHVDDAAMQSLTSLFP